MFCEGQQVIHFPILLNIRQLLLNHYYFLQLYILSHFEMGNRKRHAQDKESTRAMYSYERKVFDQLRFSNAVLGPISLSTYTFYESF